MYGKESGKDSGMCTILYYLIVYHSPDCFNTLIRNKDRARCLMGKKTWPLGFHTFQVNELRATVPASISSDLNFASRSWKKDWGRLLEGTLSGTNKPRTRLEVLIKLFYLTFLFFYFFLKKNFFISTTKRKQKRWFIRKLIVWQWKDRSASLSVDIVFA